MLYSKKQAIKEAAELMLRNEAIVREFNEWMQPAEQVRIEVVPKQYPMGWALGATLYFGDSIIKEYDFAEGAYLDLNEMVLKKMLEDNRTATGKEMSWKITYRDGSGSECPAEDIDDSAKRRIAMDIQSGHSFGSLGDDDFYAPTPKAELPKMSNLLAVRKFGARELAMNLMCPYEFYGADKKREVCSQFESCIECTLQWLLAPFDENHPWFKEDQK